MRRDRAQRLSSCELEQRSQISNLKATGIPDLDFIFKLVISIKATLLYNIYTE
jgi:hypothetical protein